MEAGRSEFSLSRAFQRVSRNCRSPSGLMENWFLPAPIGRVFYCMFGVDRFFVIHRPLSKITGPRHKVSTWFSYIVSVDIILWAASKLSSKFFSNEFLISRGRGGGGGEESRRPIFAGFCVLSSPSKNSTPTILPILGVRGPFLSSREHSTALLNNMPIHKDMKTKKEFVQRKQTVFQNTYCTLYLTHVCIMYFISHHISCTYLHSLNSISHIMYV